MKLFKKNPKGGGENSHKAVRSASVLLLTVVFALVLCGAVSAGTPLQQNQTGTVSGDLYVNTTDGWPSSTQGATNEVTQNNTLPSYTSIDSAWVYVNVYSGSGTNNWPVRTTVKLDGNGDGDYDDAGELLGVEDMNIPGTTDGTVYWLNDHCNRVYSDYQVWYDVKNLITSNNPTLYVKTENMGGDGYDGRIKMLALTVAYNDGDTDQVHYWVLNGQDWINTATSPSTSTFNTSSFTGQVSSVILNTVALSGTDGTYTLNGNNLTGNLTETGSYYKEHQWDVTSNITPGANTNITYTNVGSSFKMNLATLTIREAASTPVADFTATPTSGDSPLEVTFTDTSTGTITGWVWDFNNDGTVDSTLQNPIYVYNNRGNYTVKLTVTGPGGSNTITQTNLINVTGAKTWYVDDNGGPGIDFTYLQSAINSASSGDTIYVYAGTYLGFNVDKPYLTIKGEGADLVTVAKNSKGQYDEIRLPDSGGDATGTTLEGLTITTKRISIGQYGGSAPNVTIKNCNIISPSKQLNAGGDGDVNNLTLEGNTFSGISYIYVYGTGTAKVVNNHFSDCTSSSVLNILTSNCIISDNIFKNNTGKALQISTTSSNNTITRNVFLENGVGITFNDAGNDNKIYLNNFINNTSIATLTGTAPTTTNWSSPSPITYIYNGYTCTNYMGNYYSDYVGEDANHDGIIDTPYTIPNGLGTDNYPLIAPLDQYKFPPIAGFTADVVNGVVPLQVQFTDQSKNTVTSYSWDFNNDGITDSTLKNPTYNYTIPGTYTVKLTVTNADGSDEEIKTDYITILPDTEAPNVTANPTGGSSDSLVQVTLTATDNKDPNPKLYFTTNGDEPTTNSTPYTVPISIPATTTLKFIAVDLNGNMSSVRSETYTINDTQAPAVAANPVGGTYTNKTQVTLSTTDNVDPNPSIYYTLDGSIPTTSSTRYTGPFYIPANATNTLKFIAVDATGNTSPVQTEIYTMVPDLSLVLSITNYPFYYNTVTGTVKNTDVMNVGVFNVNVQINGNNTTVNIPGLVAGGSTTFTVTDNSKHQVGEILPVTVTVDPENVISEADETNNVYTANATIAVTGDLYSGGRFSVGHDLVNTSVYKEGNIGIKIVEYGGYTWFYGVGTATFTASDLNLPADATVLSARLYQGWTWFGYPGFSISFNGHESQNPTASYADCINGQDVFDVTQYFNAHGDNTAVITAERGNRGFYGTVLIVIYESASEPYRQIWINEGSDCIYYDPAIGYTMFGNVTTDGISSAKITTILESGDGMDGTTITLNDKSISNIGNNGSDPNFMHFDVTSALKSGENELGTSGISYFNFSNAILEITKDTTAPTVTANPTSGTYNTDQTVILTATDDQDTNVDIYYTLNGDTPTNSSTLYTGPITINTTSTLKFFAVDDAGNSSTVQSEAYTIDRQAPEVTASPVGGTYYANQTVTLTATDDQDTSPDIYYTLNGDTPTTSSTLYTGSISINSSTILKFIAVDDASNVSDVQTETYNIEQSPVAQFVGTPTTGTTPLQVVFTNTSTGTITSYAWDFDNNGTTDSTETNPTWTYTTAGTYTAKLTVTGPGGTDSTTRTIEVKSPTPPDNNPAPVAGFTANPTSGKAPLTVAFNDASTGNITSRAWDFQNDGTIDSTEQNPTYTYNTPETYVVKLTVNGPGGSTSKTVNITVTQTDKTAPVPKADLKGGLFRTTQTVTLTATDDQDTNPKIYYTLNGAAPTTSSTLYTGPISITKTTTLKFIATDSEGNTSPVQSETYTIDTTAPTITIVDPANSAVRVALGKTIKVTFNEAIQKGSKFWIELVNSSRKAIPFVASVSGKVLTIDTTVNLAESRYTLILHSGAVTDLAGNPFSLRSTCFTTGTSPLIKSTDPKNNTNLARNKAIKVTFNENIKPGKNYWIELKASNGTSVKIGKSINGKVLTIQHARLAANTKYTLTLHTGAVTDTAGNPLALKTISFTTGRT